jgi:hypothetical protein
VVWLILIVRFVLVVLSIGILPFFLDLSPTQHGIKQPMFILTEYLLLNRADHQAKTKQCPLLSARLPLKPETLTNHNDVSADDRLLNLLNEVL